MAFLAHIGRQFLGLAVAGSGLMQIINADFVRLVAKPAWLPEPQIFAVGAGSALLAIGAAILCAYRLRAAALALAGLLTVAFLLKIPEILANPGAGFVWTNPAKVLALTGGALLLAATSGRGAVVGAVASLAVFLLICGAQHIAYAPFVDGLVPAWIPPNPRFWTIFTAIALLVGGAGVLLPKTRPPAALLVGVMILLWVLLLHIPRSVTMRSAFELAGVFEALALTGVAWLVASGDGTPVQGVKARSNSARRED